MRILWVKVGGLWPLNTGGRLRSFHILSHLSRRHRVTLLTTHGQGDDPARLAGQLRGCERVLSVPYTLPKRGSTRFAAALLRSYVSPLPADVLKCRIAGLRREVSRRLATREIDLCVADFLAAMANVPTPSSVPMVLFEHNVEHMIWKRLCRTERRAWRRALLEVEWRKMRRYEARACTQASLTVTVSEVDRGVLSGLAPRALVRSIPTGVDISFFSPDGAREVPTSLVFTGSMDWYPNEDAILHFVTSILPRIREEKPGVTLSVVGRNPSSRLRTAAAEAGVQVTGTVDDVRPWMAEAAVYIVPLRIGGGTRLKIFEALAMGKPVVSTTVGAEGLPLVSGKHFLQADDPADFADAVLSLLGDPARRVALGMAGRRLVEEQYSWSHVACEFEARCEEATKHHAH
jgi:sugar transferase (PEP-CTERM/EpsH1 system associated)